MSATGCLLVEISSSRFADPLRFACGNDLELLRVEHGGREMYGKTHQGEEYLFFPLNFKPVGAGLLSLELPSSYEEHPFEETLHGARVRFKAPHGSPFFPSMPEEYWTDSGVLHIDSSGIRVHLDKTDAVDRSKPEACSCGCGGHEHAAPRTASGQAAPLAHKPEDVAPAAMNQRELAAAIRGKVADLNALLVLAAESGLVVELGAEMTAGAATVSVGRVLLPL